MKKDEFILHGLSGYKDIINRITTDLNVCDKDFEIRLILTEALTNAFKHGNKYNKNKPIYLRYNYFGDTIIFEIEDSGTELKRIVIPDYISDEDILNDNGRGLFLIKSIANKIEQNDNTLIIKINCRDRMENEYENKLEN